MHILNNPLLDLGSGFLSQCFDFISVNEVATTDPHDKRKKIGMVKTHPSNNPIDFVHGHIATAQKLGSLKILKLHSSIAKVYHRAMWSKNPPER